MNPRLIAPVQADYLTIGAWLPDAASCQRWAGPRLAFPFVASHLPELLAVAGETSYCLAAGDSGPLGFGQFWLTTPGTAHLARIIVSPQARGQGLGRLLCQSLMAQARQTLGVHDFTLRVYRDNGGARALYDSLGFTLVAAESSDELLFMRATPDSIEKMAHD